MHVDDPLHHLPGVGFTIGAEDKRVLDAHQVTLPQREAIAACLCMQALIHAWLPPAIRFHRYTAHQQSICDEVTLEYVRVFGVQIGERLADFGARSAGAGLYHREQEGAASRGNPISFPKGFPRMLTDLRRKEGQHRQEERYQQVIGSLQVVLPLIRTPTLSHLPKGRNTQLIRHAYLESLLYYHLVAARLLTFGMKFQA